MTSKEDLPEGMKEKATGPTVMLTHERCLCARHGEPFREGWPSGFPIFTIKGLQIVSERISKGMPKGLPHAQQIGWMELKLSEIPICCRLKRDELFKLYLECKKWKKRFCVSCKNFTQGSALQIVEEETLKVRHIKHVCFRCLLWKMMPHKDAPEDQKGRFEYEEKLNEESE